MRWNLLLNLFIPAIRLHHPPETKTKWTKTVINNQRMYRSIPHTCRNGTNNSQSYFHKNSNKILSLPSFVPFEWHKFSFDPAEHVNIYGFLLLCYWMCAIGLVLCMSYCFWFFSVDRLLNIGLGEWKCLNAVTHETVEERASGRRRMHFKNVNTCEPSPYIWIQQQ